MSIARYLSKLAALIGSDGKVPTAGLADNSVTMAKMARVGTAGQVLVSGGPSSDPSFQEAPGFAAGTVMLFVQTAAPTGWTKSTTHNNKALRVVSGTASSGGSVAFTTAFASGLSAGATTLSTAQIPSHNHSGASTFNGVQGTCGGSRAGTSANTGNTGGGGSHDHTLPSLAVQYVDVILATKD